MALGDLFQHGQAVDLRHIDICNDHIRIPAVDLVHSVYGVHGGYNLQGRFFLILEHNLQSF